MTLIFPVGNFPRMAKDAWKTRLSELMAAKGYKPRSLSEAAGLNQTFVRDALERDRVPRLTSLRKLAATLGVPVSQLTGDDEVEESSATSVPLISWVSAGSLKTPAAVLDIEDAKTMLAHDLDPKGDWIALQVEGDSMDRISPPESIIFVDRKDRRLVTNACYVIADAETGEASYKRFRANPDRWEPVSTNGALEPVFVKKGREPRIIGRVRQSLLKL